MSLNYALSIYRYQNGKTGKKLASSKGNVTTTHGLTKILVKMPELTTSITILVKAQITLPNGEVITKNSKLPFENYN